jgi:hypothetical protein
MKACELKALVDEGFAAQSAGDKAIYEGIINATLSILEGPPKHKTRPLAKPEETNHA